MKKMLSILFVAILAITTLSFSGCGTNSNASFASRLSQSINRVKKVLEQTEEVDDEKLVFSEIMQLNNSKTLKANNILSRNNYSNTNKITPTNKASEINKYKPSEISKEIIPIPNMKRQIVSNDKRSMFISHNLPEYQSEKLTAKKNSKDLRLTSQNYIPKRIQNIDYSNQNFTNFLGKLEDLYLMMNDALKANENINSCKQDIYKSCDSLFSACDKMHSNELKLNDNQLNSCNNLLNEIGSCTNKITSSRNDVKNNCTALQQSSNSSNNFKINQINSSYIKLINSLDYRESYYNSLLTTLKQLECIINGDCYNLLNSDKEMLDKNDEMLDKNKKESKIISHNKQNKEILKNKDDNETNQNKEKQIDKNITYLKKREFLDGEFKKYIPERKIDNKDVLDKKDTLNKKEKTIVQKEKSQQKELNEIDNLTKKENFGKENFDKDINTLLKEKKDYSLNNQNLKMKNYADNSNLTNNSESKNFSKNENIDEKNDINNSDNTDNSDKNLNNNDNDKNTLDNDKNTKKGNIDTYKEQTITPNVDNSVNKGIGNNALNKDNYIENKETNEDRENNNKTTNKDIPSNTNNENNNISQNITGGVAPNVGIGGVVPGVAGGVGINGVAGGVGMGGVAGGVGGVGANGGIGRGYVGIHNYENGVINPYRNTDTYKLFFKPLPSEERKDFKTFLA